VVDGFPSGAGWEPCPEVPGTEFGQLGRGLGEASRRTSSDQRSPITFTMDGGTTFHFVTGGFDTAYSAACETAGDKGVDIAGGASTVRQALVAGVIDELTLDIAPVLLGSGERIFDGVESFGFEPAEVLHSPLATHIRYRRVS
jgi:riboflavin biosynthesis pyrimidine reductase